MPVHKGSDEQGHYYQWGNRGKKYYFVVGDMKDESNAYQAALRQARAAYAHGYHK